MKVSELAARAGTSAKTVRYYESEGILPAPPRAENGYREYTDEDLCRVRLVVSLRSLGLELTESGRLAELCSTGRCDVMYDDLAIRVAERRQSIKNTIDELQHLDRELALLQDNLATDQPQINMCASDSGAC